MSSERHSRAQELFERAEPLALDERETFLRTACADDAALCEEVMALLEASERMHEDFLEPPQWHASARVAVGETVAHYRILRELGAGGMGKVYLAEDERLKRHVALKVLPVEFARSPERLQRFQREAESVAALNHPNIITIHSIEHADGLHFLTMELVDGPSLSELLDQSGALPVEDVLDLGVQIAEGLAEAHAAGIVHRDLKPGNVMVAPNGRVKLLDFGLARLEPPLGRNSDRGDAEATLTKEGAILGTIAYMSPEQLQGRRVDSRSDVFSLGTLLYELATGTHPFASDNEASTLAKILEREPVPLLEERPGLSKSLERIVRRCLQKDPVNRYQDTAQLLRELKAQRGAVSRGAATTAELEVADESVARWNRRGIRAAALTVAFALAVLGIWRLIPDLWPPPADPRPPPAGEINSVAVLPLRNDSADPAESDYLARGIVSSVTGKLNRAGLRVAPELSVFRLLQADPDLSVREIADRLAVETLLTGSFLLERDRLKTSLSLVHASTDSTLWSEELDQTFEDIFDLQSQIALSVVDSLRHELTPAEKEKIGEKESEDLDAYDIYLQGAEFMQAGDRESTDVALQYFKRALSIDPTLAAAHIGVGVVHATRYFNMWGGIEDLEAAEASYLAALRLDPGSMRVRRGLIQVEGDRGRSEEVLIHARDARRLGGPDNVESLLAEAQGYTLGGLAELSPPILRHVLEIDPMNEAAAWWLVISLGWSGEFSETQEACEDYLDRFGEDGLVRTFLGVAHYAQGRAAAAEEHYLKAIGPSADFVSLMASLWLGHLQQATGRGEAALVTWRVALDDLHTHHGKVADSPRLFWLRETLEACMEGNPSQETLHQILAGDHGNARESVALAATLAGRGDWRGSADLLRWQLERGSILPLWALYFPAFDVDPKAPQLADVRREYERKRSELAARFAPSGPFEGDSAR